MGDQVIGVLNLLFNKDGSNKTWPCNANKPLAPA